VLDFSAGHLSLEAYAPPHASHSLSLSLSLSLSPPPPLSLSLSLTMSLFVCVVHRLTARVVVAVALQGLLVAQPGQFKDPAKMVQLWVHESERVYGDCLVSVEDGKKFRSLLITQARKRFPQFNMGAYFSPENATPLLFCHFAENIQDKIYDQIEVHSLSCSLALIRECLPCCQRRPPQPSHGRPAVCVARRT
jgi:hypothetical protein